MTKYPRFNKWFDIFQVVMLFISFFYCGHNIMTGDYLIAFLWLLLISSNLWVGVYNNQYIGRWYYNWRHNDK